MKLTNKEMDEYLALLHEVAPKTSGKLAFVIAKNIRLLANELLEYERIKNDTIKKYGDEGPNGVYSIQFGSEAFLQYREEMKQYDNVESEVSLIMADPEDVYSQELKGDEILDILFMIKDE